VWKWYILSLISLNGSNDYIYAFNATDITVTCTDIIADDKYVVARQDNHYIDSIHDYDNALCIAIDYYVFNLNYDAGLSYDYDFNSSLMSTTIDSLSNNVHSLEPSTTPVVGNLPPSSAPILEPSFDLTSFPSSIPSSIPSTEPS
jgi:hypothetical protein